MKSPVTGIIVAVVAVVVVASIGIHHQGKSGLVPLDIKLPQPMFVGTEKPIRVSNLKKFSIGDRPPFLAPAGTTNVALGKPATSSDEEPIIGEIEMITDGDKEAADGSFVELGPFLQHITIDLEAEHEIYAVLVWHYHKQPRVYLDVIVQVADDPDFVADVRTYSITILTTPPVWVSARICITSTPTRANSSKLKACGAGMCVCTAMAIPATI